MPNKYTESLFEFADVVASDASDTGEIRVNIGDASLGTGIDAGLPLWFVDGFASRPVDPDANGAAQALFFADGNARRVVATRDRRHLASAGTLDPGDRVLYGPGGIRLHVDDSATAVIVTGASTSAENVALYPLLQAQTNALQTYADLLSNPTVGTGILATLIAAAVLDPATKTALTTALAAAYAALTSANTSQADATLASSSTLRASTV